MGTFYTFAKHNVGDVINSGGIKWKVTKCTYSLKDGQYKVTMKQVKDKKTKNPGKILTPGKWIKARAIRVHRGKLEILK